MAASFEPIVYDFELPNNGDYQQSWQLTDKTTGASLFDATTSATLTIRDGPGSDANVLVALTPQSGFTVTGTHQDPANSYFPLITMRQADINNLQQYFNANNQFVGFYDLVITYADGFDCQLSKGRITLDMGT